MRKAGKIGVWIAVTGIALVVQGCWDEQPQQLALLGDGGETPCVAVEYNANNSRCEVHREPIAKFEKVDGVACYVMR